MRICAQAGDLLKAYTPVADLAWVGIVFTEDHDFKIFFLDIFFSTRDLDLNEYSREVMDLVRIGEIEMAPVAITPNGSLVVLPPESTLDTIICSTINVGGITQYSGKGYYVSINYPYASHTEHNSRFSHPIDPSQYPTIT